MLDVSSKSITHDLLDCHCKEIKDTGTSLSFDDHLRNDKVKLIDI